MHPISQQIRQFPVDGALTLHSTLAGKSAGRDGHAEMAFAARVMAGVADMLMADILDNQLFWLEGGLQATFDFGFDCSHLLPTLLEILCICPYMPASDGKGTGMRGKAGAFPHDGSCAHPDCGEPGEYRAPMGGPDACRGQRADPSRWQYFCLQHVREFNAGWNYFDGLNEDEIWAEQAPWTATQRPTRPFAHNDTNGADATARVASGDFKLHDPHGIFGKAWTQRAENRLPAAERRALATLGLPETATLADIKTKYRQLARRYHPDANAGNRRHEARFKQLTEAYSCLRESRMVARS